MISIAMFVISGLLGSGAAVVGCSTSGPDCVGYTEISNTTYDVRCYAMLLGGGNRNTCLQPGEREMIYVRSGDAYCVAPNFTPNINTCNRQYFFVSSND